MCHPDIKLTTILLLHFSTIYKSGTPPGCSDALSVDGLSVVRSYSVLVVFQTAKSLKDTGVWLPKLSVWCLLLALESK